MAPERLRTLVTDDLWALVDSVRDLAAEIDLAKLLDAILATLGRLTDSPDASVILHDPSRSRLYFAAAGGANAEMLLAKRGRRSETGVPLEGSIAGSVFGSGGTQVANEVEDVGAHYKGVDQDTRRATASMVCVPLAVGGRRIGVLQILNKRGGPYTERDVQLAERFAEHAAIAIRNAQVIDELVSHMGLFAAREGAASLQQVQQELERPPRREELSVMFADMRGFTRLSQIVDQPEDLVRLLNEFLGMLTEAALEHGGVVNKFLGDGMLALFRGQDCSGRAVRCARAICQRFDELKERWHSSSSVSLKFLDVGVGIATGLVMVGSIGHERVREFTAFGSVVVLANHLMELARDGKRVLVDKLTFLRGQAAIDAFEGPEEFELRKPGQASGNPYERYLVRFEGAREPASTKARVRAGAKVFVSYSHKDQSWLAQIQTHLKPLLRADELDLWDDTRLRAGDDWRASIRRAIESAKVAVLLVSPNFLDSDFIASEELTPLVEAARRGEKQLVWVPVSASSYSFTPLAGLQAAVDPKRPLDGLSQSEQNRVLVEIASAIHAALSR